MTLKQFVFPLLNNYSSLGHYWWHRLFLVIFGIFLIGSAVGGFFAAGSFLDDRYRSSHQKICNEKFNEKINNGDVERGTGLYSLYKNNQKMISDEDYRNCINNYRPNNLRIITLAVLVGILSALISSYLLQLFYIKVLLFIFIGPKLREFRKH